MMAREQAMHEYDTILFDFDGTVMDTNNVIIQSWQHTYRTLQNREQDVEKIISTFGEPLETTVKHLFPDVPVQEVVEIYRSYHRDNFGELISVFPGMRELLQELKKRNYKTGLVTSRLRQTTMQGLEKYGLAAYFDVIVTADDTSKHKPDPAPINIALKRLESVPEKSMMLGDTMFDIRCAQNAGVGSVLVGWALAVSDEDRNGPDAPSHTIERAEDLLELI